MEIRVAAHDDMYLDRFSSCTLLALNTRPIDTHNVNVHVQKEVSYPKFSYPCGSVIRTTGKLNSFDTPTKFCPIHSSMGFS